MAKAKIALLYKRLSRDDEIAERELFNPAPETNLDDEQQLYADYIM